MRLNEHVANVLDDSAQYDKLIAAKAISIGEANNGVSVTHNADDDCWTIKSGALQLATDGSLQDALTMACLFYVGRCDMYATAPKIEPLRTLADVLDVLDEVLAKRDTLAEDLWNVLSALRGPDFGDETVKDFSTSPIRSAAFPKTYDACTYGSSGGNANGAHYLPPSDLDEGRLADERIKPLIDETQVSWKTREHFARHAQRAVTALKKIDRIPNPNDL